MMRGGEVKCLFRMIFDDFIVGHYSAFAVLSSGYGIRSSVRFLRKLFFHKYPRAWPHIFSGELTRFFFSL